MLLLIKVRSLELSMLGICPAIVDVIGVFLVFWLRSCVLQTLQM